MRELETRLSLVKYEKNYNIEDLLRSKNNLT